MVLSWKNVDTVVLSTHDMALDFLFFLLPNFKFVGTLTPRAQIIIAKLNNAKEKLKNIISFKMDRKLLLLFRITC